MMRWARIPGLHYKTNAFDPTFSYFEPSYTRSHKFQKAKHCIGGGIGIADLSLFYLPDHLHP